MLDFGQSNSVVSDTNHLTADSSLPDYFQLYFDTDLMDLIVTQMNKYFEYITCYFCFSQPTNQCEYNYNIPYSLCSHTYLTVHRFFILL